MGKKISKLFFDKRDHELLSIVNDVLNRDKSLINLRDLTDPFLHPHGIKEISASSGLRIAHSVINLLGSLQTGEARQRIIALQALYDEVLTIPHSTMRKNTARVLLQIMKKLVRAKGDEVLMLKLARDFRAAASGQPKIIKRELRRYHLLEMPEEWNQIAFDHHVHDVNTKGRKSATHLILDAWIKGIRDLTVVYYNYVESGAMTELLEAASIMNINVQIGIEFSALFQNKYVKIVWTPTGITDKQDIVKFFSKMPVSEFMKEGKAVSVYQQKYILDVLHNFNKRHRPEINEYYGIPMSPIDKEQFLKFVGIGQLSILHLAKFIYNKLMPLMRKRIEELKPLYASAQGNEKENIAAFADEMNHIDSEIITSKWLNPDKNSEIHNPFIPHDTQDVPSLLKLPLQELLTILAHFHSTYKTSLDLNNLYVEDVLELLYDCEGMITHLELFNLKDYIEDNPSPDLIRINKLQIAINSENVIELKRIIRNIVQDIDTSLTERPDKRIAERKVKIVEILFDIEQLQNFYKTSGLRTRIGSDSTGRSRHLHGMGFVIRETLPASARKACRYSSKGPQESINLTATINKRITFTPKISFSHVANFFHKISRCLIRKHLFSYTKVKDWIVQDYFITTGRQGNIIKLGGIHDTYDNGLTLETPRKDKQTIPLKYLNSGLKNMLKVFFGFIPAFLTFALTKDWWVLAYCGAFIWFGITGFRNILQSVLGGGGIRRSPLLKWNSYISWDRITDSLFFTGFSVPLLDYLVKHLFLDKMLNINTSTNPIILYTVMAIANGIYITSHNLFRELPKNAAFGNFFRTIFSIPLAILFNTLVGGLLSACGINGIDEILQKWAAIISKFASDCVGGIIEGLADRGNNMRMRFWDYQNKINQLFKTYSSLGVFCPEVDLLELLESPKQFMCLLSGQDEAMGNMEKIMCIHALDFLYFWMYQPRSGSMLKYLMQTMPDEALQIFVRSQGVLIRKREISQLFINGLVGKNFSKALSFYLDRSNEYLHILNILAKKYKNNKKHGDFLNNHGLSDSLMRQIIR